MFLHHMHTFRMIKSTFFFGASEVFCGMCCAMEREEIASDKRVAVVIVFFFVTIHKNKLSFGCNVP